MKKIGLGCVFGLWAMAGCNSGTGVGDIVYGVGMPGSGRAEGGEMLLERIDISPGLTPPEVTEAITVNQLYAFRYEGAFTGATVFPGDGDCFTIQHPNQFPVHEIGEDADYVDMGDSITLNIPNGDPIEVPKVTAGPEGIIDNRPSPGRHHREGNFIYGGPSWQAGALAELNLVPEGEYSIDIQDRGTPRNIPFRFPRSYDFPLGIGTDDGIPIQATVPEGGIVISWDNLENPDALHGYEHDWAFIAFASFPQEGDRGPTPTYVCFPPTNDDGSIVLSQELVDALPAQGIIQAGRMTHYMDGFDLVEDDPTVGRRFDLFAIWCALSTYAKVEQ